MIDLSKCRIIELASEMRPGRMKVDSRYIHRSDAVSPNRCLELVQFIYEPDQDYMHHVYTETHIGTYVEVSSHLNFDKSLPLGREGGMSYSEFPIERALAGRMLRHRLRTQEAR